MDCLDPQAHLRLQHEQQRGAETGKIVARLKAAINEMHTTHLPAVNIQQAKIHALEKEVDSAKATVASLQSLLQHETLQKRRLEDEFALLDSRRALREMWLANRGSRIPVMFNMERCICTG